jgi:hypothetical protein
MALSRTLLKLLLALNLLVACLVVVALVASFPFESAATNYFERRAFDSALLLPTLRIWFVLALPYAAAVHILLSRLLAIVRSVEAGEPFVPDNAVRLRSIAWALLAMQLLHLVFGVMVKVAASANAQMEWSFSLYGWLTVLLAFVLARVFEEGTRIRADLERMI